MGFIQEFRKFALRGNVTDLAIGVIIGAAFSKIVDSVVKDLFMPVIGVLFKADFSNLYISLSSKIPEGVSLEKAREFGPVFAWGNFLTISLNFIIIAFAIFLLVKTLNRLTVKEAATPPEPTVTEKLLTEIRDTLNKVKNEK